MDLRANADVGTTHCVQSVHSIHEGSVDLDSGQPDGRLLARVSRATIALVGKDCIDRLRSVHNHGA